MKPPCRTVTPHADLRDDRRELQLTVTYLLIVLKDYIYIWSK